MTDTTSTAANDAVAAHFDAVQPYRRLAAWLAGKEPDRAIAAMMVSAASKKPGKVIKRVSKPLGSLFGTPRVVKWEKGEKFVYGAAFTSGLEAEVLKSAGDAACLFQTDLYLRTREEHTEINAVTVSAITQGALTKLSDLREGEDLPKLARQALAAARVFSTGLEAAQIVPDDAMEFLVPFGSELLEVRNLPIDRTESGEKRTGQILCIRSIVPAEKITDDMRDRVGTLALAMTKDGHPGPEAFGDLVKLNARPAKVV